MKNIRVERYLAACRWLEQGVYIVPLKPRSKELQPGYGLHKAYIQDVNFARKWFLNTDANLGIVLGGSGGIIVVDWDKAEEYKIWRAGLGSKEETLVEQTARGYHYFYHVVESFPNLAYESCELKATAICMVSPSVHPNGFVYRIVNNVSISTIDRIKVVTLFPFLSVELANKSKDLIFNNCSEPHYNEKHCKTSKKHSVVERIKAKMSTVDEMRRNGIVLRSAGENTLVGLCPFHHDHNPSLWVNPESGLWGCNKPICQAAGVHDVINFRALSKGISNIEAIKQLANELLD